MAPVRAYANIAGKMLNRIVSEQKTTPAELIDRIRKGPQGPQVVAAFDFDGTLIGGYSGSMLFKERRKRKDVTREEMTESIAHHFQDHDQAGRGERIRRSCLRQMGRARARPKWRN